MYSNASGFVCSQVSFGNVNVPIPCTQILMVWERWWLGGTTYQKWKYATSYKVVSITYEKNIEHIRYYKYQPDYQIQLKLTVAIQNRARWSMYKKNSPGHRFRKEILWMWSWLQGNWLWSENFLVYLAVSRIWGIQSDYIVIY